MNHLILDNITAGYGSTTILEGFSASPISGGDVVGLLGPNAAGKSTLIKTIAGVVGHGGVVKLGRASGKDLRRRTGYVPQDLPRHAVLTAFETVVISARHHGTAQDPRWAAARVMEELGIAHLAERLISELSGGQRQLVSVAQALVTSPELLLLDEPTSALDLKHQLFLLDYVGQWTRSTGAVTVVAIHDINLAARACGQLLFMKNGGHVAQGPASEVLTPDLIAEVYGVDATIINDAGHQVVLPQAVRAR